MRLTDEQKAALWGLRDFEPPAAQWEPAYDSALTHLQGKGLVRYRQNGPGWEATLTREGQAEIERLRQEGYDRFRLDLFTEGCCTHCHQPMDTAAYIVLDSRGRETNEQVCGLDCLRAHLEPPAGVVLDLMGGDDDD
jgi:hypothetical protein